MKKIVQEYFSVLAYTVTGIVFGCAFFLLFLNFYHYKSVNDVYVKNESDTSVKEEINNKLSNIKNNINVFNVNTYNGTENRQSLVNIQNRLIVCMDKIDNKELDNILSKNKFNMQDLYKMQQFYQTNISNECLVKQLYEISLVNDQLKVKSLPTVAPFFENSIDSLKDSTDYVQKIIKDNSNYYFTSEMSKSSIYNKLNDSYYSILNSYIEAIDFIEDLSFWYKNTVGGVS